MIKKFHINLSLLRYSWSRFDQHKLSFFRTLSPACLSILVYLSGYPILRLKLICIQLRLYKNSGRVLNNWSRESNKLGWTRFTFSQHCDDVDKWRIWYGSGNRRFNHHVAIYTTQCSPFVAYRPPHNKLQRGTYDNDARQRGLPQGFNYCEMKCENKLKWHDLTTVERSYYRKWHHWHNIEICMPPKQITLYLQANDT